MLQQAITNTLETNSLKKEIENFNNEMEDIKKK